MKLDEFLDSQIGQEIRQKRKLGYPVGSIHEVTDHWTNSVFIIPYKFTVEVTGDYTYKILSYERPPDILKLNSSEWIDKPN